MVRARIGIQLVFVAAPISTHRLGERAKTGGLGIRIKWGDMSTRGLLFQWANTIKFNYACWSSTNRTSSSSHWKLTCSSPWYSWKIADLSLNNNHSLTNFCHCHCHIIGVKCTVQVCSSNFWSKHRPWLNNKYIYGWFCIYFPFSLWSLNIKQNDVYY